MFYFQEFFEISWPMIGYYFNRDKFLFVPEEFTMSREYQQELAPKLGKMGNKLSTSFYNVIRF